MYRVRTLPFPPISRFISLVFSLSLSLFSTGVYFVHWCESISLALNISNQIEKLIYYVLADINAKTNKKWLITCHFTFPLVYFTSDSHFFLLLFHVPARV